MMRHTGGWACGATSTRSRSKSWALRRASWIETIPICAPSEPTSRTCGARIRSFMRGSTETPHHLLFPLAQTKGHRRGAGARITPSEPFGWKYRGSVRGLSRLGRIAIRGVVPRNPSRPTRLLDGPDVRGLLALRPIDDVELNGLAFIQRAIAISRDRREVNKDVVPVGTGDEAVTLLVAEPFHRSLRGQACTSLPFRRGARRVTSYSSAG